MTKGEAMEQARTAIKELRNNATTKDNIAVQCDLLRIEAAINALAPEKLIPLEPCVCGCMKRSEIAIPRSGARFAYKYQCANPECNTTPELWGHSRKEARKLWNETVQSLRKARRGEAK